MSKWTDSASDNEMGRCRLRDRPGRDRMQLRLDAGTGYRDEQRGHGRHVLSTKEE